MEEEGIASAPASPTSRSGRGRNAHGVVDGERLACSHVLVAMGRVPNTDDLGLDRPA